MASQVTKSQMMNKLKGATKGAWKQAREAEGKPRGGGGLPPNLKGVVCAAAQWKMDTVKSGPNTGSVYFTLTGIILDPPELQGRRATSSWFIADGTYRTAAQELEAFANDLVLLGEQMPEDLENVTDNLASLCERGVCYTINTGRERNNGKAPNVFIQGLADGWEDQPQEGAGEQQPNAAAGSPQGSNGSAAPVAEQEEQQEETPAEVETQAEEEYQLEIGDEFGYKPNGKGKVINCNVTKIDKKKETVDLKSKTKPPKVFKGVKWADLEGAE